MLIDLHLHTTEGSPCSRLSPEEAVARAAALGLDGICLTEHDTLWEERKWRHLVETSGVVIFRGMEVSTNRGHVLVFGLPAYLPGCYDIDVLQRKVAQYRGLMLLAHPLRQELNANYATPGPRRSLEELAEEPVFSRVHGLEVLNGDAGADESRYAWELTRRLGLIATGGSDAHSSWEVGRCVTELPYLVTSEEELIAALRAGDGLPLDLRGRGVDKE